MMSLKFLKKNRGKKNKTKLDFNLNINGKINVLNCRMTSKRTLNPKPLFKPSLPEDPNFQSNPPKLT